MNSAPRHRPIQEDERESVATADLLERKHHLMKMMLKNERRANDMIKDRIAGLHTQVHVNHNTIHGL